jgi:phage shock protein A
MAQQSIFGRMAQLMRANVNAMLDSAEDPEVMLDQMIRDYTDNIAEAQEAVAQTIGNLRMLEQDAAEARTAGAEWGSKALAASQRADQMRTTGNTAEADRFDSLAKVALGKQLGFEKQAAGLEPTIAQQNEVVDKLKAGLAGMQEKLTELRDKRNELVSRAKIAEAQSRVHDSLRSIDVMDPTSELSRFEQKVRREEAKVLGANELAASSLDAQFESLESTADELEVQARLDALKAGRTAAVEAAPQPSLEAVVDAEVVHDPDSPSGSSAS